MSALLDIRLLPVVRPWSQLIRALISIDKVHKFT
jgi:hypothetical protein